MKLQWNVYRENFNSKKIEVFNIFNHGRFYEDIKKDLKKCETKEEFSVILQKHLKYYYWSKAEHEIVLTSWTPHIDEKELHRLNEDYEAHYKKYGKYPYSIYVEPNVFEKVDIYSQIMLNYNVFVDYIWSNKND